MPEISATIAVEAVGEQVFVIEKPVEVLGVDDLVALGAEVVHAILSFHAGTPFVGLPEFLDQEGTAGGQSFAVALSDGQAEREVATPILDHVVID